MNVKIHIIVKGINLYTGEHSIVSLNETELVLPTIEVNKDTDIEKELNIFKAKYIDLDPTWIYTRLYEGVKEGEEITLYYKAMIPLDTKLLNAYWLPVTKLYTSISPTVIEALKDL